MWLSSQAKLHDYRIIGNGGHPFLGGRDFDQVVVNLIEEALKPYCDISTWRPSKDGTTANVRGGGED